MSKIDELRKDFFNHIIKLKNLVEKEFKNKDEFNKTLLGIEELNNSINEIENQMLSKITSVRDLENEIEKLEIQINRLKNNKIVLENEINRLNIQKKTMTKHSQTMSKGQVQSFLLISYLTEFSFNHLDPLKFEKLISKIFEICGFKVELTPISGDEGIDILLVDPTGLKGIVQCKRYVKDQIISPKDVREFLGSMVHAGAEYGYFTTTTTFSDQAKEFSKSKNIYLIDGTKLKQLFLLAVQVEADYYTFVDLKKNPRKLISDKLTFL